MTPDGMTEFRPFLPFPDDQEENEAAEIKRRTFLGWFISLGTFAVGAILSVPLVRFALYPLTATTTETVWSELGPADEFASITVPVKKVIKLTQIDGWRKVISEKSVYVVQEAGKVKVLSAICPHLGCSVRWNEGDSTFLCPCHTGVFTPAGALVSGPPPRAMDELESRITEAGQLEVHYQSFRQLVQTKEALA
jgi:menaquinol-cytochrome c reductase iron-sulfur subunit